MSRKILIGFVVFLITGLLVVPSMAKSSNRGADEKGLKDKVVEKGPAWKVVETGPKDKVDETGPKEEVVETDSKEETVEKGPAWKVVETGPKEKTKENSPKDEVVDTEKEDEDAETEQSDEAVETGSKKETIEKGPSGQAGKSNIGHLYLYEKEPNEKLTRDDPWLIVDGGMWGKMKYNLSGPTFDFVFNGHNLPIGQSYTLIYYPDPWPGAGLICLGEGIVSACEEGEECVDDGTGNIHIKGSVDTGTLPIESDENFLYGAKIFLVPSGDVDCENQEMVGWTGDDANLYEGALITFEDTDGITDMPMEAVEKGPSGQAGKSNIGHLYLYEKEPNPNPELTREDPWLIVEGGMWGKMKYNLSGPTFDFVFNGHGLPIGQEYKLIYYPDPWPAEGLICLGEGTVAACEEGEDCVDNGTGNIHIKGSVDTGGLPNDYDNNDGAKIFLIPSADVDCENQVMVGWTGDDANLYEGALITFVDTDGITLE